MTSSLPSLILNKKCLSFSSLVAMVSHCQYLVSTLSILISNALSTISTQFTGNKQWLDNAMFAGHSGRKFRSLFLSKAAAHTNTHT